MPDYFAKYETTSDTEDRLLQKYKEMDLGNCEMCRKCRAENQHLNPPVGAWAVGKNFYKEAKKILFVGKNAVGEIDSSFSASYKLWRYYSAYWNYAREITGRIFDGDDADSIENIAFTNLVKCNDSDDSSESRTYKDTTTTSMKDYCIQQLKVVTEEIKIIRPTHIIFMVGGDYDHYLLNDIFDSFTPKSPEGNKITIGNKNMLWMEGDAELNGLQFHILRIGHPQFMKKEQYVQSVVDWIQKT